MAETLTDRRVQRATAAPGGRLELWDRLAPGLGLRVGHGRKVWVFRYRAGMCDGG